MSRRNTAVKQRRAKDKTTWAQKARKFWRSYIKFPYGKSAPKIRSRANTKK